MSGYNPNWNARNVANIPNMQVMSFVACYLDGANMRRLVCNYCNQRKGREQFSKNEQRQFDPRNPGALRCQQCTGHSQSHERECNRCGKIKPLNLFSKTSRKTGGNGWCIECGKYKDAAAPVAMDEEDLREIHWDTSAATLDAVAATHVGSSGSINPNSVAGSAINYGRATQVTHSLTFGKGNDSPRADAGANYLPPHLRLNRDQENNLDTRSSSSFNNPPSAGSDTMSTYRAGDSDEWKPRGNNARAMGYNAFAPDGFVQHRLHNPSIASRFPTPSASVSGRTIGSTVTTASFTDQSSGGFAKALGNNFQFDSSRETDAAFPSTPTKNYYDDDSDDHDSP